MAILDRFGNPIKAQATSTARRSRIIKGRYDAAQTTSDNAKYWMLATTWSADQEINPQVRQILRSRCRYELGNNTNASGVLETLSIDVIGTGPRLQIKTGDDGLDDDIEQAWQEWSRTVRLAEKLRLMRYARAGDGESFAQKFTNPKLSSPIQLDFNVIECDQFCSPFMITEKDNEVDGVIFDQWGNPAFYRMLKYHPGDRRGTLGVSGNDYELIPASSIIHYFKKYRAGQHRGIPEMTSALPLFAQLRRYTKATLLAAEAVADAALVMYTKTPATGEAIDGESSAFDEMELTPGTMTSLPDGWELGQVKAEQPTTTFTEFKRELTGDAGRGQGLPFGKATGNSSGYNYASGRLDNQSYYKLVKVDQDFTSIVICDNLARDFLREYCLINRVQFKKNPSRLWFFDGSEHVDEKKAADSQDIHLKNKTTNLAIEYGKQGKDWKKEVKQGLEEEAFIMKERRRLGLPDTPAAENKTKKTTRGKKDEA